MWSPFQILSNSRPNHRSGILLWFNLATKKQKNKSNKTITITTTTKATTMSKYLGLKVEFDTEDETFVNYVFLWFLYIKLMNRLILWVICKCIAINANIYTDIPILVDKQSEFLENSFDTKQIYRQFIGSGMEDLSVVYAGFYGKLTILWTGLVLAWLVRWSLVENQWITGWLQWVIGSKY